MTLWETDIDKLSISESYQLNRFMVQFYHGKYHLQLPQSGASFDIIDDIGEVVEEDVDTNEESLMGAIVVGVQLEAVHTCIPCKSGLMKPGSKGNIGTCENVKPLKSLTI